MQTGQTLKKVKANPARENTALISPVAKMFDKLQKILEKFNFLKDPVGIIFSTPKDTNLLTAPITSIKSSPVKAEDLKINVRENSQQSKLECPAGKQEHENKEKTEDTAVLGWGSVSNTDLLSILPESPFQQNSKRENKSALLRNGQPAPIKVIVEVTGNKIGETKRQVLKSEGKDNTEIIEMKTEGDDKEIGKYVPHQNSTKSKVRQATQLTHVSQENPTDQQSKTLDVWEVVFKTSQLTLEALTYQSNKMDVQIDLLNIIATSISGIDQKLVDLNNLIIRAQTLAETTNIECACAPIVEKLKQIPEVLSTIIDDIKNNNLTGHSKKMGNEREMCYNPRREDLGIKVNEVTKGVEDDSPGHLNVGVKQSIIGKKKSNNQIDGAENPEKSTVFKQQGKNNALAGGTTKKQRKKLNKARKKQQISSAKLELLIARQKMEKTCESTLETAKQEKEQTKSFPIFQKHDKGNEDNTGKIADIKPTRGANHAKSTMKAEKPLITIPASDGENSISELSPQKQQLNETPKNMGITENKGINYQPQQINSEGNNKDRNKQPPPLNEYASKVQGIIRKDMMCRLPDYEEEGSRKWEKRGGTKATGRSSRGREDQNTNIESPKISDKLMFIPTYKSRGAQNILNRGNILNLLHAIPSLPNITSYVIVSIEFPELTEGSVQEATMASFQNSSLAQAVMREKPGEYKYQHP
ncbi:hypothetical protein NDU88_005274 [Pleurodeles waltl]|uniref:Uncharacterized protein n=1 Tax=Pleurodeles waltl TaxID=8319 RepID=A0AAV7MCF8_PLEWA|nr:hypothetical protein NDU88_005274 [Pleurodeles waltl]